MSSDLGHIIRRRGSDPGVVIFLIVAIVLSGAFLSLGLVYGVDAEDRIPMGVAAVVFVATMTGLVAALRSRVVLAENGIARRNLFGTIAFAFDDVTTIAVDRRSSKSSLGKDLISGKQDLSTTLTLSNGAHTIEFAKEAFGGDDALDSIATRVSTIVAKKLLATLDATGTLPLFAGVEFRNGKVEGALVRDEGQHVAGPSTGGETKILNLEATDPSVQLRFLSGWAYLSHGGEPLGAISTASKNFYPLLEVLRVRTNWDLERASADDATQKALPPDP